MTFNITRQSWAFGFRNWVAMVLALLVSFWLQLDSASSAAVCVGILALPTRGQALQKGFYRCAATAVGVGVSILISGLFAQSRDLFIFAIAGWLAVCVFAAGLLEGNRAYGAVLSGYTVAIVAVGQIDMPQGVFASGINRGAAEVIGIVSLAVVNDVLFAPDLFPGLLRKLEAARDAIHDFTMRALQSGDADPLEVATLLATVTALRPDITALPGESVSGRSRASAARIAVMAMVRQVTAARIVAATLASLGPDGHEPRSNMLIALGDASGNSARALRDRMTAMPLRHLAPARLVGRAAALVLLEQNCRTTEALAAMRSGARVQTAPELPLYRSRRAALRNALRAFVATLATAYFFVMSGWPGTATALVQLAALVGISATNPSPRAFAAGAVAAMPIAALFGGITQFVVLDGADAFPLLAIAMAPPIFLASLLLTCGNPRLFAPGFLLLVFFPVFLSPTNPQTYNPLTFLETAFLSIAAVIGLFVCLSVVLPTTDAMRRRWFERAGREELAAAIAGGNRHPPPVEAFRDADRIAQLGQLKDGDERTRTDRLREALSITDLAGAMRRLHFALADPVLPSPDAAAARAALTELAPGRLRAAAHGMVDRDDLQSSPRREAVRQAAAALVFAAALIDDKSGEIALQDDRQVAA